MGTISKIRDLFDEQHEVMAWITLLLATVGRATSHLDQWPTVALAFAALVTMLGSRYYAGVKIGPSGVEVEK